MTGIRLKGKKREDEDLTYGPFFVAVGLLVLAVTLTAFPLGALGALLLMVIGAGIWLRESVQENRHLRPVEELRGEPEATGLRVPSVYWWGAAGFALIQLMVFGAAVRVAHAHGLLSPDPPLVPVTLWIGHVLMVLAVVSAGVAFWTVREARYAAPSRMGLSIGAALVLVLGHLALLVFQVYRFHTEGLTEDIGARSAALWLYVVHGAAVIATAIAFAVLLVRIILGPLVPEHYGATHAVVLFWGATLVSWGVFYVVFYLRLIQFHTQLI